MSPFVVIILGALLITGLLWFRKQPRAQRPKAALKLLFISLIVIVVILTVTGRLHWFGAALLALIVFLKKYSFILLRVLPFLRNFLKKKKQSASSKRPGSLSRSEALAILGLSEGCSREEITAAHKRLMQKIHPDHGGSTFLASQINQARDVLLQK